ncbi:hypothetical protein DPMN_062394 [Dreissena polymorpha]|uniref:Uncharacterized protein n=1 Tax=Dreissena polymorpha TaxID=45954 RepID=A0A9D4C9E8_DREPO|nr:hypothetical protein DPMN_062394 [Dreissena polymorpha]
MTLYAHGYVSLQTEVAYKAHDDRYFILTFVLCGCIAGILLAVFVVYLIRRNSRSKDKLQQITAGPEGNAEAASKDYQVGMLLFFLQYFGKWTGTLWIGKNRINLTKIGKLKLLFSAFLY